MSGDQPVLLEQSMPDVGEEGEGASRTETMQGFVALARGAVEAIKKGTGEAPACRCSQSGYKVPMISSRLGCADKAGLAGDSRLDTAGNYERRRCCRLVEADGRRV